MGRTLLIALIKRPLKMALVWARSSAFASLISQHVSKISTNSTALINMFKPSIGVNLDLLLDFLLRAVPKSRVSFYVIFYPT
jgi:hypothetical protein